MEPLVTVVVPIYNVAAYLDRCVTSIVNQTYQNLEIILVDDGSSDECPSLCDAWLEKDARVKVIHKQNGGLSSARNEGILSARGEYIAFIDSDDWIEPAFCELLLRALLDSDCDIAACGFRKCTEQENYEASSSLNYIAKFCNSYEMIKALLDGTIQQIACNKLYRRVTIGDILFPEGKYHEDEFWTYQILGRARQYVAIDYIGYNYFQRENSIMGVKYSLNRLDGLEARMQRLSYVEKNFPGLLVQAKCNFVFSCVYHGQRSLGELEREDRKKAIAYLTKALQAYPVKFRETRGCSIQEKIWLMAAKVNFVATCKLRNLIHIGM